jgi:hypothetical protein
MPILPITIFFGLVVALGTKYVLPEKKKTELLKKKRTQAVKEGAKLVELDIAKIEKEKDKQKAIDRQAVLLDAEEIVNILMPRVNQEALENVSVWENMSELARCSTEGIEIDVSLINAVIAGKEGALMAVALSLYHESIHVKFESVEQTVADTEAPFYEEVFVVNKTLQALFSDQFTDQQRSEYFQFLLNQPDINNAQLRLFQEYKNISE